MQDATREQQCLARLSKLTDRKLLYELWPVVLRIAWLVHRFGSQPRSPSAMHDFEVELGRLVAEFARRIVQWTLNNLEPPKGSPRLPPELFWHGDHYRIKRLSPTRNLNCLFGKIRIRRWLYESTEGLGLPCLFPLELQLGLVGGVATPALADRVARLAVDFSQRQVLDVLRDEHRVCWGTQTLRKVTAAVAEAMSPFCHEAQVAQVLGWLKQAALQHGCRRIVLSVGRDGVMLPIRGCKKYKEGAAATVSVLNRYGKRLGTVYLGQMPESGQRTLTDELTRLLTDVLSAWDGPAPRLVYVTDAGFHPREYFQNVLSCMPDPRHPGKYLQWESVVDYYHACQYITGLAETIFGPGRKAYSWAAKMRRLLKDKPGGIHRVLRSAGAMRSIHGLVGKQDDYDSAYAYLRRHAGSMKYSVYRRNQTPIGSGITEAACKIVFTQRIKRAGMKWGIEQGRPIVALRVIALSGIWSTVRDAMLKANHTKPRTPRGSNTPELEFAR